MFLNPREVFESGWLRGVEETDIQPNAIDISVDKVFTLFEHTPFILRKDSKQHHTRREAEIEVWDTTHLWKLTPGAYDFVSNVYVEVPEGVCGWLITKSTLNRNGVIAHSGLYDSGYKGHLSGSLYVMGGLSYIEEGARVAQFILGHSSSAGLYKGGYNAVEGELSEQLKNSIKGPRP